MGWAPLKPEQHQGADVRLWLGELEPQLDVPDVLECGQMVIGIYGGNTRAGARKNEDAAFVLTDLDGAWEFTVLLDAHYSAESARLVLDLINQESSSVRELFDTQPVGALFRQLEDHLVSRFASPDFLEASQNVYGEASCLICARKDRFLWWMNIGDCVAHLFHSDLAARGQLALNQRSFFEWIGFRNAFSLPVPCYASGVRELPEGRNVICLTTDGVFEGDDRPLVPSEMLYRAYMSEGERSVAQLREQTRAVLGEVHKKKGRDSATIIVWEYEYHHSRARPRRTTQSI